MPPFSPSNLASVEDDGASSDALDDSVLVEDGVNLALTRPFIFLGLTILGLVGLLFLLMYCSYRIIRSRQLKNGGIVPSLKQCPFRIVALRNQFRGENNGVKVASDTSEKTASSSLSVEPTRVRLGDSGSGSKGVEGKDVTELSPIARHQSVVHADQNSPHCIQGRCDCLRCTRTVRLVPVEESNSNNAPYLPLQADQSSSTSLLRGVDREHARIVSEVRNSDAVLFDSAALHRVQIDRSDFIGSLLTTQKIEMVAQSSSPGGGIRRSRGTFHLINTTRITPAPRQVAL